MKKIEVRKRKGLMSPAAVWIKRVVAGALKREKVSRYELSIYLTDNREIRRINKQYLKHDYATDVISFNLLDDRDRTPSRREALAVGNKLSNTSPSGRRPIVDNSGVLGDLVVSAEMARTFAKDLNIPFKQELARYLVHGTLHLLGYDDHKPVDYKKMHARQEWLLNKIL